MMLETKLWTVFCALLLIHMGSADHGNEHAAASPSAPGADAATEAPSAVNGSTPSLQPTGLPALALNGSEANTTSSGNSSLISNVTKEVETTTQSPELQKDNDTFTISPSAPAAPETNSNLTEEVTSQPGILHTSPHINSTTTSSTSSSTTSTTTTSTNSTSTTTTTTTTTAIPVHSAHNASGNTTTSHPSLQPPDSNSTSEHNGPQIHSTTSAPKPETTTTAAPSTQSSFTSSTRTSTAHTLTSTQTSQSNAPQEPEKSTNALPSSPAAQAEAHADTPSQLNVGGDTTMVHESPTLDPLLAGLVTAFIITAVIITLLLFLKLRRRDNRPEFRRLQDLPMDDMMEDTPLSMYSY